MDRLLGMEFRTMGGAVGAFYDALDRLPTGEELLILANRVRRR